MSLDAMRQTVSLVAPVTYAGRGLPHFAGMGADDPDLPADDPNWGIVPTA